MAITDFGAWLNCVDLSDYNDVYSLYLSVNGVDECGGFKTVTGRKAGTYIVQACECDDDLLLASEAARDYFLSIIEMKYCGDMDIEAYYAINHAIEKDD